MMPAHVTSATLWGVDAREIEIEVDLAGGVPRMTIVGQPGTVVQESRERVRAAIRNSGYEVPPGHILVNLAPADIRKEGPRFDLPIAIAALAAMGRIDPRSLDGTAVLGELAIDGRTRSIRGVLPMVAGLRSKGVARVVVPEANGPEAALVSGVRIIPVASLQEAVGWIAGSIEIASPTVDVENLLTAHRRDDVDMAEVKGQAFAKRALEIAAAGGHHVLLSGPPGAGKTMLVRRLPTILPPMTEPEAIEATRVHSVAGALGGDVPLVERRPFRAPHPTISTAALVGGGSEPRPGEISLAHRGVLFLDELPEFERRGLEALRQPLEEGTVTVDRTAGRATFPARATVVAAMNPCPCGYYGSRDRPCRCGPLAVERYQARISGPLRDRFDIQLVLDRIPARVLDDMAEGEPSSSIRARVMMARGVQRARYGLPDLLNGDLRGAGIRRHATPTPDGRRRLSQAIDDLRLSARTYTRILRVARTIADLDGSTAIDVEHVDEALMLRCPVEALAAPA